MISPYLLDHLSTWYAAAALCLLSGALVFALRLVLFRKRTRSRAKQAAKPVEDLANTLQKLRDSMRRMDARLTDVEQHVRWRDPAAAGSGGLNLTARAKALRLYRLGQAPELIAGQLNMPAGETRFMLKIHQLVLDRLIDAPESSFSSEPGEAKS